MRIEKPLSYGRIFVAAIVVILLALLGIWVRSSDAFSFRSSSAFPFRFSRAESRVLLPMITVPAQLIVEPVGGGFSEVTAIETAGDERLFIVQREGAIQVLKPNGETAVFLDLTDRVNSDHMERGLLDIAFHPDFASNGYFYVSYTADDGERDSVVSRFQVAADGQTADPASELHLLRVKDDQIVHNAGELLFHPLDGNLYYTLGDDWQPWLAQDPNSVKGKLLRLLVSQEPTADLQPQFDARARVPVEIVAMGLRNPWRFDFDADSGRFFIADVGDAAWEEINILTLEEMGANFGWPCKEGPALIREEEECANPGPFVEPAYPIERSGNFCAVVGGKIHNGGYLFGDFCARELFWLQPLGDEWTAASFGPLPIDDLLTTFGRDSLGNLYIGTLAQNAPIYRLTFPYP